MKNAFVFARDPLKNLAKKLPQRLRGACLSIMRYVILEANHSESWWDGKQLQRGQIFTGLDRLHRETGLSPRTVRSSIALLKKLGEVTSQPTSEGTLYNIVNYDNYDGAVENPTNQVTNDRQTTDKRPTTSNKELKKKEGILKDTEVVKDTTSVSVPNRQTGQYQASPEAQAALAEWENLSPLPDTANRPACLKTFDDLHRLDHLSWDRIHLISVYACQEWVPKGFIHTPAKLRRRTRNDELLTWEAIERQLSQQPRKETFAEVGARLKREGII